MNTRPVMTWLIFWSSVILALCALAWVSVEVVALEQRQAQAQLNATRQETIRRALWRMDSRMAPILAIEASRPSSDYASLANLNAAWLKSAADLQVTNPAQGIDLPYAQSYFNFAQDQNGAVDDDQQIVSLMNTDQYTVSRDFQESSPTAFMISESADAGYSGKIDTDSDYSERQQVAQRALQSPPSSMNVVPKKKEEPALKSSSQANAMMMDPLNLELESQGMASESITIGDSALTMALSNNTLRPKWIKDDTGTMQLVLMRTVIIENQPVVQGVLLDWKTLRADLLDSVNDVLPGSSLVPVNQSTAVSNLYQLATIPVAFIPPSNTSARVLGWSPATIGLLVTWIAIISTIIAVGIVLRAAIVLSQRRGHFVTAVTHELRTPLTTFRLYAQMLADGMVTDEQVKSEYLSTLKRESERLTGIVENVLEYARLTRARSSKEKPAGVQTLSPGALIARFRPALARRAQQSNLDLVVSMDLESHQDRTLTVDPHAVERIMMNLIENACKYASPNENDETSIEDVDTRIHLDTSINNNILELLVSDHGPGIAHNESARIFGEFQRGSRGLFSARSGLGLGLALSRGLAREMQGDLVLTKRRGHGAEFLLTIPLDAILVTD